MEDVKIIKVGNIVGGGKSQGGSTYSINGISPALLSGMSHGNTVPYIIEVIKTSEPNQDRKFTTKQPTP